MDSIGLIAGNRSLPLMFAREARRMGMKRIVAVAFENETNPELANLVDKIIWVKVGQLSKLISAFTDNGITRCVMLGQVAPKNLFDVRPDLRAMGLLFKIKHKNAETIFGAIAGELLKDGVELIDPIPWMQPYMPQAGFHLGPKLSDEQKADVELGYRTAKETSRLEIGQMVVVKGGAILAVEAFEGTDRCLMRGGELAGKSGGAVAVKVAKLKHDMRWDIPCIGPQTLKSCANANVAVLAVEAGKTLMVDPDEMKALIDHHRITLTTAG
jgi:UDP-2,3-diacylglucosamine hydrolase